MKLAEILEKSGFSDKEAAIYTSLLEGGPAVASDLAGRAGINRSTAYVILEALAKRGLVSYSERRGVKLFTSADPEHLVRYFEDLAKQYAALAKASKSLLPSLKEKNSRKERLADTLVYEEAISSLENLRLHKKITVKSDAGDAGLTLESKELADLLRKAISGNQA